MSDTIDTLESLFGTMQSYYESIAEVSAEFCSPILPCENEIMSFVSIIPVADRLRLVIADQADDKCIISNGSLWIDEYRKFKDSRVDDCQYVLKLVIDKNADCSEPVYVYSYKEFSKYIEALSDGELLRLMSNLYKQGRERIYFAVLDSNVVLDTKYITLSSINANWANNSVSRSSDLKKCADSSTFLDFHTIGLIPQDFHVIKSSPDAEAIAKRFSKLETILSYAYVASTAYTLNGKMVVQLEPGKVIELEIEAIESNRCICEIYEWAFSGDSCIERASIARNVLKLYCKNAEQLASIDDSILTSIKSNYNIYQKDTTEKYIELKEKISDFIIETTVQLQELIRGLVDGIRNNFVAVVTFVITVLLTNSLANDEILDNGLPRNLIFVSQIFIIATTAYWIATIVSAIVKWRLMRQGYEQIKENYRGVLDEKDIENAFKKDAVIKSSCKKVTWYTVVISVVWVTFILIMAYTVWLFSQNPIADVPPSMVIDAMLEQSQTLCAIKFIIG